MLNFAQIGLRKEGTDALSNHGSSVCNYLFARELKPSE
jgi:hypothetical protein